jgi:NADP-dependent 3-hydroxy acid dehydrogenase YdfG
LELEGAAAVVTGASRGIGASVARALAAAGASVHLVARSDEVHEVARSLGSRSRAWQLDVTEPAEVEDFAKKLLAEHEPPDILINNAGSGRYLFVEETSADEARQQIESPYLGAFFVTRAFLPSMLERRQGRIANVTSPAAWAPWPGATGYSAARWAMRGFNAALRADLSGTGLSTMLICPGKTRSTYFAHNPGTEERIPKITAMIPAVTPDQVAASVIRGLRRDASFVAVPWQLRLFLAARTIAPWPFDWLIVRTGWRREVQQPRST